MYRKVVVLDWDSFYHKPNNKYSYYIKVYVK